MNPSPCSGRALFIRSGFSGMHNGRLLPDTSQPDTNGCTYNIKIFSASATVNLSGAEAPASLNMVSK
ncbi:MAG: hypothetical protein EA360_00375 [Balneolaceae bacterium]|nr:MAG: hypothetical protein EA360_00375 [Balneolaceae bacterium]